MWKRIKPEGRRGRKVSHATVHLKPEMGMWNRMKLEGWSGRKVSHAAVPFQPGKGMRITMNPEDEVVKNHIMLLPSKVWNGKM